MYCLWCHWIVCNLWKCFNSERNLSGHPHRWLSTSSLHQIYYYCIFLLLSLVAFNIKTFQKCAKNHWIQLSFESYCTLCIFILFVKYAVDCTRTTCKPQLKRIEIQFKKKKNLILSSTFSSSLLYLTILSITKWWFTNLQCNQWGFPFLLLNTS